MLLTWIFEQFKIYKTRTEGDIVNFGESRGDLIVGLVDKNTQEFVALDPKYF